MPDRRELGRAASTISREVNRNGGRARYRAQRAERQAVTNRRRPKPCKLAASPRLQRHVDAKLRQKWSPQQIAGWLRRTHPHDAELQVSHETIYRSLYIQSRGALNRQLTAHLRTRRQVRQPGNRNRARHTGKGQIVDPVHISERPAEAADRAVPGHWEGDLILGKGMSAIGTLVERSTRYLLLFRLENLTTKHVTDALRQQVITLPEQLARSVTWDQGKEMALHAKFTIDTGIQIYFVIPRAPGSAAPTRTPTGCCANTFPSAPTSSPTVRATLTTSLPSSMAAHARPSNT